MGMRTAELQQQRADTSLRFYIDREAEDDCWIVVDRSTGEEIGRDGGEPEDQLLVRDWQWVAEALNALDAEWREKLRDVVAGCNAEHPEIHARVAAAVAAERERCAKVAEDQSLTTHLGVAAAIRALPAVQNCPACPEPAPTSGRIFGCPTCLGERERREKEAK